VFVVRAEEGWEERILEMQEEEMCELGWEKEGKPPS
jgi:hypothetical protein